MTAPDDRTEFRLPRALRPFHHREYRFLIASMAISLFASGMWIVALVWQASRWAEPLRVSTHG